jgi:hypothetical protein
LNTKNPFRKHFNNNLGARTSVIRENRQRFLLPVQQDQVGTLVSAKSQHAGVDKISKEVVAEQTRVVEEAPNDKGRNNNNNSYDEKLN